MGTKKFVLIILLGLLSFSGMIRLLETISVTIPLIGVDFPIYHIEGWTLGVFEKIEKGLSIYSGLEQYQSPIYQPIPYYLLYRLSAVGSHFFTDLSPIGISRMLSVVLLFLSQLALASIFTFLAKNKSLVFKAIGFLSVFFISALPLGVLFHVGVAFPHEVTKFFLAVLACSILWWAKNEKSKTAIFVLGVLLAIAPWMRQTFVIFALPVFVLVCLQFIRQKRLELVSLFVLAASLPTLCFFGFLVKTESLADYFFWTVTIPSLHERSFSWMPDNLMKFTLLSFIAAIVFIRGSELTKSSRWVLMIWAFFSSVTTILHSSKQGSGIHMIDTIVFPACALGALYFAQTFDRRSILPIIVGLLALGSMDRRIVGRLKEFPDLPRTLVLKSKNTQVTNEIFKLVSDVPLLSMTGPIHGLSQHSKMPYLTSVVETSYTRPKLDSKVMELMDSILTSQQWLLLNLNDESLMNLPKRCEIADRKSFLQFSIFLFFVKCNQN